MVRYTVHFEGQVQGVGFRYTAVRIAERYAAAGYVRNLEDGRVLLAAEGEEKELAGLVEAILERMGRYVRRHTISKSPASGQFTGQGLSIRH